MIDTIRFEIKNIGEKGIQKISQKLDKHIVIEADTGAMIREVVRGSLRGTWDNRISIQIRDYEYKIFESETTAQLGKLKILQKGRKTPVQVDCEKYLVVEFSLAKWIHGINFLNTSLVSDAVGLTNFRLWLQEFFGVDMPRLEEWSLRRFDVAINFDLHNDQNIKDYMSSWRGLTYPRRKKPTIWENSLFVPGSTTTIKIYDKKAEFKKHDEKRLSGLFKDKAKAKKITSLLDGILRFEVEYHKRKLEALKIKNIFDMLEYNWVDLMKTEIYRIVDGAKTTRTYQYSQVVNILQSANLNGMKISAARCAAVWSLIVVEGKKFAVQTYGRQGVWRACKVFEKLQINTLGHLTDRKVDKVVSDVNIFSYDRKRTNELQEEYYKIAAIN